MVYGIISQRTLEKTWKLKTEKHTSWLTRQKIRTIRRGVRNRKEDDKDEGLSDVPNYRAYKLTQDWLGRLVFQVPICGYVSGFDYRFWDFSRFVLWIAWEILSIRMNFFKIINYQTKENWKLLNTGPYN